MQNRPHRGDDDDYGDHGDHGAYRGDVYGNDYGYIYGSDSDRERYDSDGDDDGYDSGAAIYWASHPGCKLEQSDMASLLTKQLKALKPSSLVRDVFCSTNLGDDAPVHIWLDDGTYRDYTLKVVEECSVAFFSIEQAASVLAAAMLSGSTKEGGEISQYGVVVMGADKVVVMLPVEDKYHIVTPGEKLPIRVHFAGDVCHKGTAPTPSGEKIREAIARSPSMSRPPFELYSSMYEPAHLEPLSDHYFETSLPVNRVGEVFDALVTNKPVPEFDAVYAELVKALPPLH